MEKGLTNESRFDTTVYTFSTAEMKTMDKKYIGKTIALPKDVADRLLEVQTSLTQKLGFEPSLAETIAYMAHEFRKKMEEEQDNE